MAMTIERAEKLAAYLKADPAKTKELFELPVEEALAKINADGNDFTVEELKEFDEAMVNAEENKDGELDASALEGVSGGAITIATATLALAIVEWGTPYAIKAGKWLGNQYLKRRR